MIGLRGQGSGDRGLHRVSPMANLVLLLVLVTTVLASPGVLVKAATFVLILCLLPASGEPVTGFLRSLRFVLIFAGILFLVQALTLRVGMPLRPGGWVTDQGMLQGLAMALRFLVVLSASYLFVTVTDPDRLAQSLISIGIPYRYGYLLILALRFVPFFQRELRIVREAQKVRGIHLSVRRPSAITRAARYTFVPVLVSALSRVDSIAMSMKGRCFGRYPNRTSAQSLSYGWRDGAVAGVCVLWIGLTVMSRLEGWL